MSSSLHQTADSEPVITPRPKTLVPLLDSEVDMRSMTAHALLIAALLANVASAQATDTVHNTGYTLPAKQRLRPDGTPFGTYARMGLWYHEGVVGQGMVGPVLAT